MTNPEKLEKLDELEKEIEKNIKREKQLKDNDKENAFKKNKKIIFAALAIAGSVMLALFLGGVVINPGILGMVVSGITAAGAAGYIANEGFRKHKKNKESKDCDGKPENKSLSRLQKELQNARKAIISKEIAGVKQVAEDLKKPASGSASSATTTSPASGSRAGGASL